MKSRFVILMLALTALNACSKKKDPRSISYDENLQAPMDIPSYTRNALDGWPEGRKLDPHDASRVRIPENVHTYHLGRLPSRDRREMHEAHSVYRIGQSATWDQRLPATPMASRGVVLGIREPSHDPVPKDQIITSERERQSQITAQLEQRLLALTQKQQEIEAFLASAPDKNKTIVELQQQNEQMQKEYHNLQEEHRRVKDDLREIKERQAMEEALRSNSLKRPGSTPGKQP
jgi:hypothetical protein